MSKSKALSFVHIYILLWIVYNLQSIFFGRIGSFYSQAIVLFLTMVSIYYAAYAIFHYRIPPYMKGLSVLVILLTIYGLVLLFDPNVYYKSSGRSIANHTYLLGVFNSTLPIYPFYVFTRQKKLTKTGIQRWTLLFFVVVTLQYQVQHNLIEATLQGSAQEEFTNNYGYTFLSIIPLLAFFRKKRVLQYVGLAYAMTFVILSMKRGAILIGAISIVCFLLSSIKNEHGKKKTRVIVLSVVLAIAGYYLVNNLLETSDYFNNRIERTLEGNSSNRDILYSTFLYHFLNETSILRFLFGNGANATLTIMHQYAHNDWLELAINQGVLGIFVYLLYWGLFYKTWRRCDFNDDIRLAVGLLLIIFFVQTIFSMSYGAMTLYSNMCLGYCMGALSDHDCLPV